MIKIVYTGTITKYHQWALPFLDKYDVEFVIGRKDYKEIISKADICVSIVPECSYEIIPIKVYDYIEQRKKILHFTPDWGYSLFPIRTCIVYRFDPQSKVDDFILNGETDYSQYDNDFSIDRQYAKLKAVLDNLA